MEGLGQKFQQARLARNLTLDEAARMTKIRPSRLAEIEADDFSQFPSLAYAKGFLIIYGKFLDVDVTSELEAFETSEQMSVDGYSYLQDNPTPKPTRVAVVRKQSSSPGSLLPFVIGVVVLVVGFALMKSILNIGRIKPKSDSSGTTIAASTTPSPPAQNIVAPRALPVDNGAPAAVAVPRTAATAPPTMRSTIAAASSTPAVSTPAAVQPEVRRAEPVHSEDVPGIQASTSPPAATGALNRVEIRPLRKTYVKIVVDNDDQNPALERWISSSETPIKVNGQHIAIRVLDRNAVEIKKNGKRISSGDADVTVE
ncbi:MAG: helix-turn-helix domain-containing protein [Chthoniobacterales bacterium]